MNYLLLIHHDEEALATAPPSLWGEYAAFNDALSKAGVGTPGERLQPGNAARLVRVRDGRSDVVDGPFADTKEQFAGYLMLNVPDLDAAISWAARCPSAQYGTIEIRPVWPTQGG